MLKKQNIGINPHVANNSFRDQSLTGIGGFCVLRFFINTAAFFCVKVKFTRMTRYQEDKADKFGTFVSQII